MTKCPNNRHWRSGIWSFGFYSDSGFGFSAPFLPLAGDHFVHIAKLNDMCYRNGPPAFHQWVAFRVFPCLDWKNC